MNLFESAKSFLTKVIRKTDDAFKTFHDKKTNLFLSSICLFLIFFIILLFNMKTFMVGDDYAYSFIFTTNERVSSLYDIFRSQYIHYFTWGGRSVVHMLLQGVLLLHPMTIDIINSAVFVLFLVLCCFHIQGSAKFPRLSLTFGVFALIWIIQPAFANTILWITGAANYLWGTTIILLFLLPYRLYNGKTKSVGLKILYTLLLSIGGILAGWTNENTSAAMLIMAILFLLSYKSRGLHIPTWGLMGVIGAVIGYTMMIAAPGNFARAEGTSTDLFMIVYRILTYTQAFVNYLGVLNLLLAISTVVYLKYSLKKNEIFTSTLIYSIGLFISIYSMVLSPAFPARAWFGPITLNIILFGIVISNLDYTTLFARRIKYALVFWGILIFGFSAYDAYNDVNEIYKIRLAREYEISKSKQEGAIKVTFKQFGEKTKFGLGDTPYAKEYISNYYGIDFELE